MFRESRGAQEARIRKFVAAVKKVREDRGFLRTPLGKKLLQELVDLRLRWPQAVMIFGRSQGTIEKACSFHGVRRPTYYISWPAEAREVIGEYEKKLAKSKNKREFAMHFQKMCAAANKALVKNGFSPKSRNAINCFFRNSEFYKGPYGFEHVTWSQTAMKVLKRFYKRSFRSRTKTESVALSDEMMRALNAVFAKEGLPPKSLGAVRQFAHMKEIRWGWHNGQYPSSETLAQKERQDKELARFVADRKTSQLWRP